MIRCSMTRLLCVRLGAGPSSATLVNLHIVRQVALSQANIWSSRAVACSAILTPRSSSPKKARILMASPSEAQNAIAIQSQGFERTANITCPFRRRHPRTECDSAFYVASAHCARVSAAGLAERHLRASNEGQPVVARPSHRTVFCFLYRSAPAKKMLYFHCWQMSLRNSKSKPVLEKLNT
jgi:hypothetical protein